MLPECIAAVIKAAGRHVSQAELDGIEERLKSSMQSEYRKSPEAWRAMTREQRFEAASKVARGKYASDLAAAQARTIRDVGLKARELRMTDSFKPGVHGRLAALRQRLTMQNKYSGDLALEAKIKGAYQDYTRELDGGPLRGKFWGLVQNPTDQHNLIRAIYGDKTGNPEIDALGQHVRDVLERARQTAVDSGMQINPLDNWHLPQPWAWEKIGANRDAFVRDMMAHIDPTSYINKDGSPMSAKDIRKLVEASAETLGTDGANKRGEAMGSGFGGGVGAKRNAPRQLHFRNADGYIHMMDNYGSANNVMSMLDHHFHGLARDTATARAYGRDADRFVSQMIDRAFAADSKAGLNEKQLKQLASLKKTTIKEYDALRNPGHPGSLPMWAQVSNTLRGVVGSTLLGGSTISAIPDVQMALSYGRLLGMSKASILGNMAEGAKVSKEHMAYVRRLGITAQTMQEGTERFGAGEMSNQAVRFMNHGVHVLSLLRMWDRSMTHGFSASLMDLLGSHVGKDFSALAPKDQAYLQSRGVTPEHYAVWQKAELETGPNNNHTMLTPDSIYAIQDDLLRPIAEQKMADVSASFKADADKRDARAKEEVEWAQKRQTKLDELRQKAKDTLAALKAKASVKEGVAQGAHDARAEHLSLELAAAEIENKLNRTLAVEKSQDRVRGILADVAKAERDAEAQFRSGGDATPQATGGFAVGEQWSRGSQRYTVVEISADGQVAQIELPNGRKVQAHYGTETANGWKPEGGERPPSTPSSPGPTPSGQEPAPRVPESAAHIYERASTDNASRMAVNKGMSIGEQIGRDRAIAAKRVRDSQAKVDQLTRDNKGKLSDAQQQLAKKLDAHATELREFTKSMQKRADLRANADDLFEKAHGMELDRATRALRSEAAQHLLALTLSESQIGARGGSGNSIRDNVALHITPDNAGTIMGQMARWILFLKQTPLGIFRTHMVDVPGQMNDWKSKAAYQARFLAGSAGLGALALTTKQILLGNDPDNLLSKKGLGEVAMASGGFGMYGDFFFGDHGDHQNNALVKLLGPGATAVSDAIDLYHNTADEAAGEDTPHYGSKALKFARNYAAPFTRLWYLKAAFNHDVYQQLQENLNPGYNARVNQRMQAAGQNSWWPSGDTAPSRAPDLGAAIGQPAQ